jgi:cation diffusion facilitator CzcD-associated flavoprotein CzcO
MQRLYAPAALRGLVIDDAAYAVAEDGTVEVRPEHVRHALAHGCTVDAPKPALPVSDEALDEVQARGLKLAEGLADHDGRLAALEARLRTLEVRLAAVESGPGKKG